VTTSPPRAERDVDVSGLPTHGFGRRAPTWWGVLLFVVIELTVFVLLLASTLFLRENLAIWPTRPDARLLPGSVFLGLALSSVVPVVGSAVAARRKALRRTRGWLVAASVVGVAMIAARAWELAALPWRWDVDAHASCVWMSMGMHTFELVASVGESVLFAVLFFVGPIEDKTYVDVDANAVFSIFVVVVWLPFYALFYVAGRL
jgi:heme/copper-type cytochrome/quinol oxidase subunit 3